MLVPRSAIIVVRADIISIEAGDIPPGARWTRIDRRLVNPGALEEARERFEERQDYVIVLRVLTKLEIQNLADRTNEIREAREREEERLENGQREASPKDPTWYCMYNEHQGTAFANKAALKRHYDQAHTPGLVRSLDCTKPGCHRRGDLGFRRKDKLDEHMREVHKADIPKRASRERT